MRFLILLSLGLIGMNACGHPTPGVYPPPEPLVVPDSLSRVWAAAIDVATEANFVFDLLDRASGYLRTRRMILPDGGKASDWDCGGKELLPIDDGRVRYRRRRERQPIEVEIAIAFAALPDGSTRVRINATAFLTESTRVRCSSRGEFERQLAERIRARWAEMKRQ